MDTYVVADVVLPMHLSMRVADVELMPSVVDNTDGLAAYSNSYSSHVVWDYDSVDPIQPYDLHDSVADVANSIVADYNSYN